MTDPEEKSRRLTPVQWQEAATLYELGDTTMSEIADRYGVSVGAVSQMFRKMGVERGSRAHEVKAKVAEKAVEAVADAAASFAQDRKTKILETKFQSYKSLEMIHVLTHKAVVEAKASGRPLGSLVDDLKALRLASAIFAQTRAERFAVLDADNDVDEASLPEIHIRDLTEVEIATLQSGDETDFLGLPGGSVETDVVEEDGS